MNGILNADMLAATRRVRAGRLGEATALLQRMLRGEPTGSPADASDDTGGTTPRTIDATAETIELGARRESRQGGQMPEALRGFLDRLGKGGDASGLDGLVKPESSPLPDGARFLSLSFTNEAGSRDYKLYLPSGFHGQALPLVVMLHGCTQSPDDFAAGTRMNSLAEEQLFLVAYPAQAASANVSRCWNWFRAEDQQRGRGEPALIAGITRQVMRDYPVDPLRVYVAGMSAGGAAAAVMGATYPDLYAAVGVHAGLAPGAARDMPSAFAAMQGGAMAAAPLASKARTRGVGRLVPTIVFHGDGDKTVHPRNGEQVAVWAGATGASAIQPTATVQEGRAAGGRPYRRSVRADRTGRTMVEMWVVRGAGHAWSGGSPAGSYTDPEGPDASREMVRFFLEHAKPAPAATSDA
jgi:poly(hydroxyalkanoate) depolymerase family esterase